jgi:hypothetical protein
MDNLARHDIKDFAAAETLAAARTAETGVQHIAVDDGANRWPRYNVVEAPKVGEFVSQGFNGDYYPVGKIVKIGANYKNITCDDGSVFRRVKQTGGWKLSKSCFWMVKGNRDARNPSF